MRARPIVATALTLAAALLLVGQQDAYAASSPPKKPVASAGTPVVEALRGRSALPLPPHNTTRTAYAATVGKGKNGRAQQAAHRSYGGISCVPYARAATGIAVSGNAWQWWDNAAGSYARGQAPESGSVLSFRSNLRMPMGHVAVVTRVMSPREVAIDHANWPAGGRRGTVSRGTSVVDVSERNDWSAVRVELGTGDYGSVYPTNGFIYNRTDTGTFQTRAGAPAPMLALNAAPRDLRPTHDRFQSARGTVEYAEQPAARNAPMGIEPVSPKLSRVEFSLSGNVFNGGN